MHGRRRDFIIGLPETAFGWRRRRRRNRRRALRQEEEEEEEEEEEDKTVCGAHFGEAHSFDMYSLYSYSHPPPIQYALPMW